nr:MAG TPA: hypothetical protein [Caudoviricetes sp.]
MHIKKIKNLFSTKNKTIPLFYLKLRKIRSNI